MLAGYILGQSACLYDNKNAVQLESYGPEARGGAAASEVVVADEEIDYPRLIKPDVEILMSQAAFNKYRNDIKEGGMLILDRDLVIPDEIRPDIRLFRIPATEIAQNLGKKIIANMVMLGALTALSGIVSKEAMQKSIETSVPKEAKQLNLQAFEKGFETNIGLKGSGN